MSGPSAAVEAPPRLSTAAMAAEARPLSLRSIRGSMEMVEEKDWFRSIVEEIAGDKKDWILGAENDGQTMERFYEYVGENYFAIREDEVESLTEMAEEGSAYAWGSLNRGALPELYGFWMDEAHEYAEAIENDLMPAVETLMPIILQVGSVAWDEDEGIRISWRDAAAARFGPELIDRIPPHGYMPPSVIETLQSNEWDDCALLVEWMTGRTNHEIMNRQITPEDPLGVVVPWYLPELEEMAEQVSIVQGEMNRIRRILTWFEEDPAAHLNMLLNVLETDGCEAAEAMKEPVYTWTQVWPPPAGENAGETAV